MTYSTRIILRSLDADASTPGHLIHHGETPVDAARRVAPSLARHDEVVVIVSTNDPLVFDLEIIADEARTPELDEDGEWVSETYDLSKHKGAVALAR